LRRTGPGSGHRFDPSILREYDVRGIVGETLFAADAAALGRAFATIVRAHGGRRVCVGMDGRLSSPELAEAAVEGVRASGVEVLWIGRGPRPCCTLRSIIMMPTAASRSPARTIRPRTTASR
jgi:phosphomannomutase